MQVVVSVIRANENHANIGARRRLKVLGNIEEILEALLAGCLPSCLACLLSDRLDAYVVEQWTPSNRIGEFLPS